MKAFVFFLLLTFVALAFTAPAQRKESGSGPDEEEIALQQKKNACTRDATCSRLGHEFQKEPNREVAGVKRQKYFACVNECKAKVDAQAKTKK
uniref:Uncharacterized protein n=1 Tax=Trichuris muris TaxID=70415 RepID=A0A5S6QH89_TRIMR